MSARFVYPLVAFLAVVPAATADPLEDALIRDAHLIFDRLMSSELNPRVIAILKFKAKIGNGPSTFDAGYLPSRLAARLEQVLIMIDKDKKLTLVTDANARIADEARSSKNRIAWDNPDGRRDLARIKDLPILWDPTMKLTPDCYLSGLIHVDAGMSNAWVELIGFTREQPEKLVRLGWMTGAGDAQAGTVPADRDLLAGLAQSFALPPASRLILQEEEPITPNPEDATEAELQKQAAKAKKDAELQKQAAESARKARVSRTPPTATVHSRQGDAYCPVRVRLRVNGKIVDPIPDAEAPGNLRIPPGTSLAAGGRVEIILDHAGEEREMLGVVVTVNGRNTLAMNGEETLYDARGAARLTKWLLDPGTKDYTLKGFYTADAVQPFEVLPEDAATRAFAEMDPAFRGLISLFVFGTSGRPVVVAPADLDNNNPEGARLLGGKPAPGTKMDRSAYRALLLDRNGLKYDSTQNKLMPVGKGKTRGRVIVPGQAEAQDTKLIQQEVTFHPQPIAALHVRYYGGTSE